MIDIVKRFIIGVILSTLLVACEIPKSKSETSFNYLYYSDYFVFISDDIQQPLVVPYDLNWSPTAKGYEVEFKGWYGTQADWPIAYLKHHYQSSPADIPSEYDQHQNIKQFAISPVTGELSLNIAGSPQVVLQIPEEEAFIAIPNSKRKTISAAKTVASVDGKVVSGWLLHEKIRASKTTNKDQSFGEFTTFFWIPIIVDGKLYHFEQHADKQTANRWSEQNGKIVIESAPDFELKITATIDDETSKRKHIPNTLVVNVPQWQFSVELESGGAQVGYGDEFPNGLAYYRQSMLTSTPHSKVKAYGMLELIIEND